MSSTKTRIFKNAGAYSLVGIIPYMTGFIMLPVYTRYMSPEDYGILSLVSAFQAILVTVVSLQLNVALPRYYFEYSGKELKVFFSTTMYSVAGIAAAFFITINCFGGALVGLIFPRADIPYFPYFFISLLSVFAAQVSQVAQRLLVVQERGGVVLVRSVLAAFFGVAAGLYFVVYLDMKALGALLAALFGGVFLTGLNIWLVRDYFLLKWQKNYFMQSIKYSWPIVAHAVGGYLFMYSDRIVMEKFIPLSAIGIYAIADKISMILKLFVNSINDALMPNFVRLAKQSEEDVVLRWKRIITKWAVFISFAYLGLALFSEEAIVVLTPETYHGAYPIVPILLLAYVFRGFYCFSSAPIFYRKKTQYIPVITISAGILNIVGNILLIPVIGVYGAAWTTVLSFAVTFVLADLFSRPLFCMKYEWGKLTKIFVPMLVCTGCVLFGDFFSFPVKLILKVGIFLCYGGFLWVSNIGDFRSDIFDIGSIMRKRLLGTV